VTSSDDYEGNYGYRIADTSATLSDVDESHRQQAPDDYLEFLTEFGFGGLDAAFHLDDGPEKYSTICGREMRVMRVFTYLVEILAMYYMLSTQKIIGR
jgi:hypothetical protein